MQRIFATILAYLTALIVLATCTAAVFDAGHTFSVAHPNDHETTLAVVEVRNATRVADHQWVERLTSPSTSLDITVTRPALLVAIWWGDGTTGTTHNATPNNGFTVIDSLTLDQGLIQCIVATKSVTAGTYNVTWTSESGEGAQLWLIAVDEPAGSGTPVLGGHTLAWDQIGSGGTDTTTVGITTNASVGAGSVILAAVGHQDVDPSASTMPTSSEGETFAQVGTAHAYTDWPEAGTALYAAFPTPSGSRLFDYDADGKADISVYRPSGGSWWVLQSESQSMYALEWGSGADRIAPADYDGDGKTDVAIYRPASGQWWVLNSQTMSLTVHEWGIGTDIIAPGDYTGDGKADYVIWRPSEGGWYVKGSDGTYSATAWGIATDKPVAADYDGDSKYDLAIFRTDGNWWIRSSLTLGTTVRNLGIGTDKLVPSDYTGDGKADVAIWRPSDGGWWYLDSTTGAAVARQWGIATDIPAPADYDGNGKTDLGVFRPNEGNWWIFYDNNTATVINWGTNGDQPTPNAFVR